MPIDIPFYRTRRLSAANLPICVRDRISSGISTSAVSRLYVKVSTRIVSEWPANQKEMGWRSEPPAKYSLTSRKSPDSQRPDDSTRGKSGRQY